MGEMRRRGGHWERAMEKLESHVENLEGWQVQHVCSLDLSLKGQEGRLQM